MVDLVPTLQSPGLTLIEQQFQQGQKRTAIKKQVDIITGEPSADERQDALVRISTLNPQIATSIRGILQAGDTAALAAINREAEKGFKQATLIQNQKTFAKKQEALLSLARETAAAGGDPSPTLKLLELPEDQLNLEIQKKLIMGTDLQTLTGLTTLSAGQRAFTRTGQEFARVPATPAKPETGFTLKPGEERFAPGGARVAAVPAAVDPEAPFTLAPGQERFGPGGERIAGVPALPKDTEVKPFSEKRFQQEQALAKQDLQNAVNQAIQIETAKQEITQKTPVAQLKKQLLEGKVADAKIQKEKIKMRAEGRNAQALIVEGKIDEAIALTDRWFSTGFFGSIFQVIGGTDARNLRGTIDTIQAILGFGELQAMRDASPSGGALGQIAVRELELLQSTIASLDIGLDDEILVANLQSVRTHIQNWKRAVDQSAAPGAGQIPPADGQNIVVDF